MSKVLPQSFYERDALVVARELLGQHIHHGSVVLRITEVEAYRHPDDTANHCRMGRTRRNAPMWGPGGHAYVYLCYGMHNMLNLVTGRQGQGAAVLIRACEPVRGHEHILARRDAKQMKPVLLTGPGKVGCALGLDTSFSGHAVFRASGALTVRVGESPRAIACGPRIGIGYATRADQAAPYRLAVADCAWVSVRKALWSTSE